MFGLGLSVFANHARSNGVRFNPAPLFRDGDDGFLANFSDLNSMFQESAAAVPVTGSGDPCAVLQDRGGNGHAAVQSVNDDFRPVLGRHPRGGVRNLLTWTEGLGNAAWLKSNCTVTPNTVAAPDGTMTADTVEASEVSALLWQTAAEVALSDVDATASLWIKAGTVSSLKLQIWPNGTGVSNSLDIAATSEWVRYEVSAPLTGSPADPRLRLQMEQIGTFHVWGAQLELTPAATAYQKVTSEYDVTEVGQPDVWYLQMDGIDDRLVVPSRFGMSAAPDMTVIVAMLLEGDGSLSRIWNLGGSDNGIISGAIADNELSYRYNNGNLKFSYTEDNAPSIIAFLKSAGDTYGEGSILRNGVALAESGSSSPASAPISTDDYFTIGSRGDGGQPVAARIYGLMIIDRVLTEAEIARVEQYYADQIGVTL